MPSNDDFTLSLITNDEVLAVNQHSLHNRELKHGNGLVVWTADIPNSEDRYVAFFNSNDEGDAVVSVNLAELGADGQYLAKDLWSKEEIEMIDDTLSKNIAPHASAIFRLMKKK